MSIILKLKELKRNVKTFLVFWHDYKNYSKNSLSNDYSKITNEHVYGLIIRLYHTLEKGLSNKKIKYEFSLLNVKILQNLLLETEDIDHKDIHVLSAISTLKSYYKVHENIKGSDQLKIEKMRFEKIEDRFDYKNCKVIGGTKDADFSFSLTENNYLEFIKSRSSIRDYKNEELDIEVITNVIDIAKYCPSACNRQAIKIFYSLKLKDNEVILNLQNGSKTFRNRVPGLLVVCSDLRYQEGPEERNLGFIEGGIWINSITNAFHLKGYGSCVLNWCVNHEVDKKIKELINIPDYYQISALIAFGRPAVDQKVPYSIKRPSNDFISEINL